MNPLLKSYFVHGKIISSLWHWKLCRLLSSTRVAWIRLFFVHFSNKPTLAGGLPPEMVSSILRANEKSVRENVGAVKGYEINYLKANTPIEDRFAHGQLVTGGSLFGVFDGHGGHQCAESVNDRLFNYIAIAMADHDTVQEVCQGRKDPTKDLVSCQDAALTTVDPDLEAVHVKSLENFAIDCMNIGAWENSAQESLTSAFCRLDNDISTEALPTLDGKEDTAHPRYIHSMCTALAGSTGCVVFIKGVDVWVANVGDSQAVLGAHSDIGWETVRLSKRHDAENQDELKRLFRSHPNESFNIIKNARLFGTLAPLRAFGNIRYKWSKENLIRLLNTRQLYPNTRLWDMNDFVIPDTYRTPPYLIAEPEIRHHRLSPMDKFLVLASDGLWERLRKEFIVQLVGGHMTLMQSPRRISIKNTDIDLNSATHLLRRALGPSHLQVSEQLALPEKEVRFRRDDITVYIIYFDSNYLQENYTTQ